MLDAYGWTDIWSTCEFLLDYEEEETDDQPAGRGCKKPWRYRWPDEVRDEVLARLLAVNQERAEQERLAGNGAGAGASKKAKPKKTGTKSESWQLQSSPPPQKMLPGFDETNS